MFGDSDHSPIRVSIGQFFGIEINDFAVAVAKTALWIAQSQMLKLTEDIVHLRIDFLPLKSYSNIHEANALRIDWETVVPKDRLNYIMGNPPFSGARIMGKSQKEEMFLVFGKASGIGNLDYVAAWYKKASEYVITTAIHAAFVSTNSITQGEQPAILWKPLMDKGVHIDFAYRTFKWSSQSNDSAAVHCVIIGFSILAGKGKRHIYTSEATIHEASNINAYLVDAPDIFVESRNNAICDVPKIGMGNQPIDDGSYLFSKSEMDEFLYDEPEAKPYFHLWYGADEYINNRPRYCLYLGKCSPNELQKLPKCLKLVHQVREYRLKSPRESTIKLADTPTHFQTENMPDTNYVIVPEVSSEKRRYIPIGFFTPDILCSNLVKLIPGATLYHFGILTSNIHMAWVRAICGRLEMRYRYSKDIVYNNFPWPNPTDKQKAEIEQTAQAILDARALYPDSSLADLYDEVTMPPELRKAHQNNDRAVMQAYGFSVKISESECVAELMKLYQKLIEQAKT